MWWHRLKCLADGVSIALQPRIAEVGQAIVLADKHRLTVYDALYPQLALDVDGELATLDADLRQAATAEGLATTP